MAWIWYRSIWSVCKRRRLAVHNVAASALKPASSIVGAGFDDFRWPRQLHIEREVLEVRPSKLLRNHGLIEVKAATQNQNDEAVQVEIGIVPRRQSGELGYAIGTCLWL